MPVTAVIGAQWGDEGKGRIIDYLSGQADMVIRCQGGDNAGHTVVNEFGRFVFHLIPSGICRPATCIIGAGTVINPDRLFEEMADVESKGLSLERLWLDRRAHLVMPYHPMLDGLEEAARAGSAIGTTKRGIGPAYADKSARWGLRIGDLLHRDYLRERLSMVLPEKNHRLQALGAAPLSLDNLMSKAGEWAERLHERIVDTLPMVRDAVAGGKRVILEGQLGALRDLDWGTYPFVTSSCPTVTGLLQGAGVPARALTDALGITKAYTTAVGAGPFPTELDGDEGWQMREIGREYGATTGRPRRCGWFDAVAVQHSAWLNGYTMLAVTKLDILDTFPEIQLCTAYRLDGKVIHHVPDTTLYEQVEPIYETMPGWLTNTVHARRWEDLPAAAQNYLNRIQELVGVPLRFVSVGPEREQLIVV
ncbi:MAG: adenylosuccinate synthase [Anaerolineae bacterium]|nr:adenylosuccinate synthase [Anaerolineae bacterium]